MKLIGETWDLWDSFMPEDVNMVVTSTNHTFYY